MSVDRSIRGIVPESNLTNVTYDDSDALSDTVPEEEIWYVEKAIAHSTDDINGNIDVGISSDWEMVNDGQIQNSPRSASMDIDGEDHTQEIDEYAYPGDKVVIASGNTSADALAEVLIRRVA